MAIDERPNGLDPFDLMVERSLSRREILKLLGAGATMAAMPTARPSNRRANAPLASCAVTFLAIALFANSSSHAPPAMMTVASTIAPAINSHRGIAG